MTTPEALLERLDQLGITTTTRRHPPVYTVEQSRTLRGALPGAHCKNLFLKDKKDRLWLAVTFEHQAVDLKRLEKEIGSARLSFGKPALLLETLGVEPGSVTPFAIINDHARRVSVVLDRALLDEPILNFHPLRNDASTQIAPDGLLHFLTSEAHVPILAGFAS
jgi:Ala-tRNA(Pro) deacylase